MRSDSKDESFPGRAGALTRRQLGWFLLARVLVITLFLGGTIFYHLRGSRDLPHPVLSWLYFLVGVSYLQALVSAVLLPRMQRLRLFAQVQISCDLFFVTLLIYITGGIESIFSFLYLLVIVSGSVFLGRKEVLFVASAAAILYGSLLDLQFYGYLPHIGRLPFPVDIDGSRVFYAVFVNVIAFFLTAILSGTASERLRKSESALEAREVDYEELDKLNRTILANITSGLMIINRSGRIRSFNAAASKITGYSLEEAYDWDVRSIFPNLRVLDENGFVVVSRREAHVLNRRGEDLTLGYATSPVDDPLGKSFGLLITFQDLTDYKVLEEQLKRSDRLAAVGRLAAGIAHEIRNPLASISGSVQLLMEGEHIREEDRRLMGIVVREADRLSGLLTDFLVYARPAVPKPAEVNVSSVLDELADVIVSDKRFSRLTIIRNYPPNIRMLLDRQQIHQALWNLAINSAEAMEGRGILRLGLRPEKKAIFIEDSGPGIPPDIREKIFDPFFTTKDAGTGLGLPTVHTIVEAHGGRIEVTEGKGNGVRFTIYMPKT